MDKTAAEAIIHFSKEIQGLTILALGPLTNLAKAVEIDEMLPERVEQLTIMGGNLYGTGNSPGQAAEYNFWFDFHAAEKVISRKRTKIIEIFKSSTFRILKFFTISEIQNLRKKIFNLNKTKYQNSNISKFQNMINSENLGISNYPNLNTSKSRILKVSK